MISFFKKRKNVPETTCVIPEGAHVENVVTDGDALILGSTSDVKGVNIEVEGRVDGSIKATGAVTLQGGSIVTGDITCRSIFIAEGVEFASAVVIENGTKEFKPIN